MAETVTKIKDEADPNRCQGVTPYGQCNNVATHGGFCNLHAGGHKGLVKQERQRNYYLGKYQQRVLDKADNPEAKNLREEIGIMRLMLEERFNRCQDETDLLMNSSSISEMVDKIQRLVVSCHKIEDSMGQLLDKQATLQMVGEMLAIIGKHVTDEKALDAIADEFASLLSREGDDDD